MTQVLTYGANVLHSFSHSGLLQVKVSQGLVSRSGDGGQGRIFRVQTDMLHRRVGSTRYLSGLCINCLKTFAYIQKVGFRSATGLLQRTFAEFQLSCELAGIYRGRTRFPATVIRVPG